jgi:hypothetical protein
MTEPTGQVQVAQSDLDNFATAVNAAVTDITTATTTIAAYIQTLLANQSPPLPAGDEDNLNAAVTALQAAGTALDALEPPTPTP